jgi:hypothetical protein
MVDVCCVLGLHGSRRVHAASINPADLKHLGGELKGLVRRDAPVGIGRVNISLTSLPAMA